MYKSFDALSINNQSRDYDNIDYVEIIDNIKLPDLYLKINEIYNLGRDTLKKNFFYDEQNEIWLPAIGYYYIKGDVRLSVEEMLSVKEALSFARYDFEKFNFNNCGILRIALTNDLGGGGIYLGVKQNNSGIVYKATWDQAGELSLLQIADDLNEFIEHIVGFSIIN